MGHGARWTRMDGWILQSTAPDRVHGAMNCPSRVPPSCPTRNTSVIWGNNVWAYSTPLREVPPPPPGVLSSDFVHPPQLTIYPTIDAGGIEASVPVAMPLPLPVGCVVLNPLRQGTPPKDACPHVGLRPPTLLLLTPSHTGLDFEHLSNFHTRG
jgi:hypothetical protein